MPLFIALSCLCATTALATTYTWTGMAPSSGWSQPQNWSPSNSVPGAGDTANIGPGITVNVDSGVEVGTVSLGSGSTLNGVGSLTIDNMFSCLAGTLSPSRGITVNGSMSIEPATLTVTVSTVTSTLTINGSGTINANAQLQFNANSLLVNNGTFTVADSGSINMAGVAGAMFVNQSLFIGGNAVCGTGDSIFSNAPSGTVQINGGATFQFQGTLANSGTFSVGGGGQASISATAALHGGSFTGSGNAVLTGNDTLDGNVTVGGQLQFNGSALTLNGTLEVQGGGDFIWLANTLTGVGTNVTGTIQVDASGTMVINPQTQLTLRNCSITNNGNLNWTNSGTVFMGYNAQIVNQGFFNIDGDGSLEPLSGGTPGYNSASIYNVSVPGISKFEGLTNFATVINVPCYGLGGLVTVYQGVLQFDGGGDIGNWSASGGIIQLENGNYNSSNGSFFSSNLTTNPVSIIIMRSGVNINIPIGGILFVFGNFQQTGGTISGNGRLAIDDGGGFIWNGGTIALTNPVAIIIGKSGTMNFSGANVGTALKGGGLQNNGTINWVNDNSAGGIYAGDNVIFDNFGAFNIQCNASLNNSATTVNPVFTNEATGTITKSASTGLSYIGIKMVSLGLIIFQSGNLEFYQLYDTASALGGLASKNEEIMGEGGNLTFDTSTTNHGTISGSGKITIQSGGGTLTMEGNLEADDIPVVGDLVNDGGAHAGDAPGIFSCNNYTQTTNGWLFIPIRGTNAANLDFGQVNGGFSATLAGTLEADITAGYAPPVGATFPFITSNQRHGTFNNVILPPGMQLNYTSGGATLVVTGAVPVQIISPAMSHSAATSIRPPRGVNLIALESRLIRT